MELIQAIASELDLPLGANIAPLIIGVKFILDNQPENLK